MSVTPHWNDFQQHEPRLHEIFQAVANTIFDSESELIPLPDLLDLGPALNAGILTRNENGEVGFASRDIRDEYLVRHATGIVLALWDVLPELAAALDHIASRGVQLTGYREIGTGVLILLAQEHGKNIAAKLAEFAVANEETRSAGFWALYPLFCEALPMFDTVQGGFADALDPILRTLENDYASSWIYQAIAKFAQGSAEVAEALYHEFSAYADSPVVSLVPNALVALSTFEFKEAHEQAMMLTISSSAPLLRAGVAALAEMTYGYEQEILLTATLARLEELRAIVNPQIDPALARAYGNLLDRAPSTSNALLELAARTDPSTRYQLSFVLMRHADMAHTQEWYRHALLSLAAVASTDKGTIRHLDHCVKRYVQEDSETAVAFLEAFVRGREYGREGEEATLPEMFPVCFSELSEHNPEVLEKAITHWFASPEIQLHRAAYDSIPRHIWVNDQKAVRDLLLHKPTLDVLDEQTVVYTLQRVMGWMVGGRSLAVLVASALRREPCSPDLARFIAEALGDFVMYNYPKGAGDYLRARLQEADVRPLESEVIHSALTRSEAYLDDRRRLPAIAELLPPSQRTYQLRLARNKLHEAAMERERSKSTILNLVTRVPLKYGRAFFFEGDGEFSDPSPLHSYEHEIEIPRGELIDPVGSAYQRLLLRNAGLQTESVDGEEQG